MVFPGHSGSTPAAAELGATDDPRVLVPGNPEAIQAILGSIAKLSAGIDQASTAFTAIDEGQWQGAAGDAFRSVFHQEVPNWRNSSEAFDAARKALQEHAHTLAAAQKQAGTAVEVFNRGQRATATAQNQYNQAVAQHNAQTAQGATLPEMAPFADPGEADRREAQEILDDARRKVQQSGDAAAAAIGAARDSAPQGPGALERFGAKLGDALQGGANGVGHLVGGAISGLVDIVKPIMGVANPTTMLMHPMQAEQNSVNMAAGLVHAVTHPVDLAKGIVDYDDWGKDPAAAVGKTAVNVASMFVGGEGAAAKGVEIGEQAAKVAGVGEKAAETGGNAGRIAEEAGHQPPLKPADWQAHQPGIHPDTPFGRTGSESLPHDPPQQGGGRPDGGFGPLGSDHPALHGDLHDPTPADHTPPPDHQPDHPAPDHQPDHPGPDLQAIHNVEAELDRARSVQEEFLNFDDAKLESMSPAERTAFQQQAQEAAANVRRLEKQLEDLKARA